MSSGRMSCGAEPSAESWVWTEGWRTFEQETSRSASDLQMGRVVCAGRLAGFVLAAARQRLRRQAEKGFSGGTEEAAARKQERRTLAELLRKFEDGG
jgi:hypothetical protein